MKLLPEGDYSSHYYEKPGAYFWDVFFITCQFRLELFIDFDTNDSRNDEPQ